ncbi:related to intracellular protein transport protein [Phialocephala subalpina]|uniref:Related to intracellular protein transport protein n=1 Tax=Phialocephala subalpina TaxID=576137 RepID=A0A1L7X778_9HELO|nr:related to intracellular protein transport protein [Phialocephala subalpina]
MAAVARSRSSQAQGNINPSVPISDTLYASDPSELQSKSRPPQSPTEQQGHKNNRENRLPSLSLRRRTETISSVSSTSSSPVRRKPLPATASPLATRFSSGEHLTSKLQLPEQPFIRPWSVDSPTLHEFPPTSTVPYAPTGHTEQSLWRPAAQEDALTSEYFSDQPSPHRATFSQPPPPSLNSPNLIVPSRTRSTAAPPSKHARLTSESALTTASESTAPCFSDSSSTTYSRSTMSVFSPKPTPPHNFDSAPHVASRSYSNESNESNTTIQKSQPKSPGTSKLGSFFGWGGNSSPSSTTTFSEKSFSPIPSPGPSEYTLTTADASRTTSTRNIPSAIDVPKANAEAGSYFGSAYLQLPLATPTTPVQVEEMEKELKEISAELASSIRREMDLEDLVERLQAEAQNPSSSPGKRTSDYFSDSGTSSVGKYGGEPDYRQEELDRSIRKVEQEKAQMRLELTGKVQDERTRRKHLEGQIRNLEEKASQVSAGTKLHYHNANVVPQVDLASINSMDANGRLRDLEATCEDLRRRLAEEKQVKDNFEDLLTALKSELLSSHNERDNLRDEIVPQLRARVEGLEAQAAEHEKLTYEQSKMQQELQTLKNENMTLLNAQRLQHEMNQQMKKFNTIVEENEPPMPNRSSGGLMRSNSVAQTSASRAKSGSLSRSISVKGVGIESRDALAERVKDVEAQRDALHRALKSLLERQEYQNRENQKRIRQLEMERDRALTSSPKRISYDKEVANLREEINTLRRRADEAIEQKWQCEKGLSGLKMDLDRAEQEIGSLRSLLEENDILIPTGPRERTPSGTVSSESLERAYRDLQKAYAESLERVKNLEISSSKDEDTEKAMQELEQSLANAMSERNFAQKEADSLREQSQSLRDAEKSHVDEETVLADELRNSAKRVEELAVQVRQQLNSNATLRQRLAETIERGEKEQKTNAQKIMFMQSKLKTLEDQLMAAQQASEEKISKHEDEIRDLKESHNIQLQRMKDGLKSPRLFAPKSPITPLFANSAKAPRIMSTSSGKAMTVSEDSKMEYLKQRVIELEGALADADKEMEEVVGRMNIAQIEVMELQNEREEAVRETKRLQKMIEDEKVRAFEGRFATFQS